MTGSKPTRWLSVFLSLFLVLTWFCSTELTSFPSDPSSFDSSSVVVSPVQYVSAQFGGFGGGGYGYGGYGGWGYGGYGSSAPTIGTASLTGTQQVSVSFTVPTNYQCGSASSCTATSSPGSYTASSSGTSPIVVTGLPAGQSYTFTVACTSGACGASGPSAASNSVSVPASAPSAAAIGTATASSQNAAVVAFTPGNANGATITSCAAVSNPSGGSGSSSSSPITVTGLSSGTSYTFTVTCTNSAGTSAASSASNSITTWSVPSNPTIGTATAASSTSATVAFSVSNAGGTSITGCTAHASTGGASGTSSGSSPITVTGLTAATQYTFTVICSNSVGSSGASSASNSVTTPAAVPGAPTIGTATAISANSATVAFTQGAANGAAISQCTATSSTGTTGQSSGSSPITVTGLAQATGYTFTVTCANSVGTSGASSASNSITTWTVPTAPTIGTATAVSSTSATVAFTANSNGGTAVTGCTAVSSPGSLHGSTGGSSPITVSGLTPATAYTFTVTCTNSVGQSGASGSSASITTPTAVPGTPTIGTVTAQSATSVSVAFTAGSANGASISQCTATSSPSGIQGSVSGSSGPITVSGLGQGSSYTFTVKCQNSVGSSAASGSSSSVTTWTVPSTPSITGVTVVSSRSITVSFSVSSTGGTAISSCSATSNPDSVTVVGNGQPSSITVTGLRPAISYKFTVYCTNSVGNSGSSSASSAATTLTDVPDPPTIVSVSANGGTVQVTFTEGSANGSPITSCTAISNPAGHNATGTSSPIAVNGFGNTAGVSFTMVCTNAIGTSTPSGSSVPLGQPTVAPTISVGTATSANQTATIPFSVTNNGGAAVTACQIVTIPPGYYGSITSGFTQFVVSGLTPGNLYQFALNCTNSAGTSAKVNSNQIRIAAIPPQQPSTPTLSVTSTTSINVAFTQGWNGGAAVASCTALSNEGDIGLSSGTSPIVVYGLDPGTVYQFVVYCTNSAGSSANSASSQAVLLPAVAPDAPSIINATAISSSSVLLWLQPDFNGGSNLQYCNASTVSGSSSIGSGSSIVSLTANVADPIWIVVPTLNPASSYLFQVTCTNAVGSSPVSSVSGSVTTLADRPSAPTVTSVAALSDTQVRVAFTAGVDNGAAITGCTATSSAGVGPGTHTAKTASAANSPITVTGLTTGVSYTFTVTCTNGVGTSLASAPSNSVTTWTIPAAPTILNVTVLSSSSVTVYVKVGLDGSGGAVQSCAAQSISSSQGNTASTASQTGILITGLSPATSYQFVVVCSNVVGPSPQSAAASGTTLNDKPNPPTVDVAAVVSSTAVLIQFTPGAANGLNITSCTAASVPAAGSGTSTSGNALVVQGLAPGHSYQFSMTCTNSLGTSSKSGLSSSVTTWTIPTTPVITSISSITAFSATIAFSISSDGGSGISSCTLKDPVGDFTSPLTFFISSSPLIVNSLSPGTQYSLQLSCSNIVGASPWSNTTAVFTTLPTSPVAPVIGQAVPVSTSSASVSFRPGQDRGSVITQCRATTDPGGAVGYSSGPDSSPIVVLGLTPNIEYNFTVACQNAYGWSDESLISNDVNVANGPPPPIYPQIYSVQPSTIALIEAALTSLSMTVIGTNFDWYTQIFFNGVQVAIYNITEINYSPSRRLLSSDPVFQVVFYVPQPQQSWVNTYVDLSFLNPHTPLMYCSGTPSDQAASGYPRLSECPPYGASVYFSPTLIVPGIFCSGSTSDTCELCPANAYCPGGNRAQPLQGYYTPSEQSGLIYACDDPTGERCTGAGVGGGDNNCGIAYTGPLCSECADGYYSSAGVCLDCSGTQTADPVVISVFTFLFFAGIAVAVAFVANQTLDRLAVTIVAIQQLLTAGSAIYVYFTTTTRLIFGYIQVIRFDFSVLRGQCTSNQFSAVDQFLISLSVLIGIFICYYLAALVYQYRKQGDPLPRSVSQSNDSRTEESVSRAESSRQSHTDSAFVTRFTCRKGKWKWFTKPRYPRAVRSMIVAFYITYVQMAVQCLSMFNCDNYPIYSVLEPPSPTLRLYADQTVVCYQGRHLAAAVLSALLILFYILGLPLFFLYKLYVAYRTAVLELADFRESWSFLYRNVRVHFFYYRLISFAVHLTFAVQVALIRPQIYVQLTLSVAVYGSQILAVWLLRPFLRRSDQCRATAAYLAQCSGCGFLFLFAQQYEVASALLVITFLALFGVLAAWAYAVRKELAVETRKQTFGGVSSLGDEGLKSRDSVSHAPPSPRLYSVGHSNLSLGNSAPAYGVEALPLTRTARASVIASVASSNTTGPEFHMYSHRNSLGPTGQRLSPAVSGLAGDEQIAWHTHSLTPQAPTATSELTLIPPLNLRSPALGENVGGSTPRAEFDS